MGKKKNREHPPLHQPKKKYQATTNRTVGKRPRSRLVAQTEGHGSLTTKASELCSSRT